MKWYIVLVKDLETLMVYSFHRNATSAKEAVSMVKLNPNEEIDSVYVQVEDY